MNISMHYVFLCIQKPVQLLCTATVVKFQLALFPILPGIWLILIIFLSLWFLLMLFLLLLLVLLTVFNWVVSNAACIQFHLHNRTSPSQPCELSICSPTLWSSFCRSCRKEERQEKFQCASGSREGGARVGMISLVYMNIFLSLVDKGSLEGQN